MSDQAQRNANICIRCGQAVAPRGAPPRFCPTCGQKLPRPVRHEFAPVERPPATAVAALVLGIFGFIPVCGGPLGVGAVVLGLSARGTIKAAGGRIGGIGIATVGMVLGLIATVFWLVALGLL